MKTHKLVMKLIEELQNEKTPITIGMVALAIKILFIAKKQKPEFYKKITKDIPL